MGTHASTQSTAHDKIVTPKYWRHRSNINGVNQISSNLILYPSGTDRHLCNHLMQCQLEKVPAHLYPAEQTKYWWEKSHWKVTHNTQETNNAACQLGGTGIVILNQLAHRAQCLGDDKVGLGRWCWVNYEAKTIKCSKSSQHIDPASWKDH